VTCPSGRRCNSRKVVCVKAHRGFKSHRHRHNKTRNPRSWAAGFFCLWLALFWQVLVHGHKKWNTDGEVGGLDGDDCRKVRGARKRGCD